MRVSKGITENVQLLVGIQDIWMRCAFLAEREGMLNDLRVLSVNMHQIKSHSFVSQVMQRVCVMRATVHCKTIKHLRFGMRVGTLEAFK